MRTTLIALAACFLINACYIGGGGNPDAAAVTDAGADAAADATPAPIDANPYNWH
jgi:hypothetical protein